MYRRDQLQFVFFYFISFRESYSAFDCISEICCDNLNGIQVLKLATNHVLPGIIPYGITKYQI